MARRKIQWDRVGVWAAGLTLGGFALAVALLGGVVVILILLWIADLLRTAVFG